MCGIAGYYLRRPEVDAHRILRMTRILEHRGPDDEGLALHLPETGDSVDLSTSGTADGVAGCRPLESLGEQPHRLAMGSRRFSIVDPSPAGHQPFWSAGREVCVTVNGELYNYVELREELETLGHAFRTTSDTEVLAYAYLEWGESCFERLNGFWALAINDTRSGRVLLARDRIGKSPLYIVRHPTGVFWASEIKALQEAVGASYLEVSDQAITDFVLHGYRDHFHRTFYENVQSLPNATYAWVEPEGLGEPQTYWSVPTERATGGVDEREAASELGELLADALRIRMRADVPVGFELSGGMDSSSLVASAAVDFGRPMKAYTVSWADTPNDEETYARAVAERYPSIIDYHVLSPPRDELLENPDRFIWLMEQPFRSPSVLAYQGILRAMSEQGMRVSINGTGGDELFAGYDVYREPYLRSLLDQRRYLAFVNESGRNGATSDRAAATDYLRGGAELLAAGGRRATRAARQRFTSTPQGSRTSDLLGRAFRQPDGIAAAGGPSTEIDELLVGYMGTWLMNYWQRVVNQASMGVPVEVRSPLLDHRIVEFAFRLPVDMLIHNGWTKWLLRKSMSDILPASIVWREQKQGFPFPHRDWVASNQDAFFATVGEIDCPYLDLRGMRAVYPDLAVRDPRMLWRLMSIALWWKRCVQGEQLTGVGDSPG